MGLGGISVWQLVIVAVIVALLFGTKRLRGLGGDLGTTIKGFKQAMSEDNKGKTTPETGLRVETGGSKNLSK
ncbi:MULTISPECIES: twin-arginine translocase TatA/TatE family subunit [unclassified Agarivorans]|uniref:twin-arginine translocase TatA/TatE family subunit n=1 Tax=unclassified Agarivorans TaxID=2636026 RepID=UPI0026E37929|nr:MULTISPECIES: twin-arginine translocase TatA/TatE family subunit [unclassified Agarivorans]MDO6685954.1 twin-arginine translocase TatA/TatE family subunit [Agarivorans sp. 3_MG-2023]MDO6713908.1 twin-arginine translocase TatA/TatE family subunit [Agarivorans sp. 2_MG-2023]